ncbi:hypothetical protein BU15DRAFT_57802 [Melanogaster broomeanus]|nr:hypothetical protein BU15DRAFT_57802 [Melanogaster broomeanus]
MDPSPRIWTRRVDNGPNAMTTMCPGAYAPWLASLESGGLYLLPKMPHPHPTTSHSLRQLRIQVHVHRDSPFSSPKSSTSYNERSVCSHNDDHIDCSQVHVIFIKKVL